MKSKANDYTTHFIEFPNDKIVSLHNICRVGNFIFICICPLYFKSNTESDNLDIEIRFDNNRICCVERCQREYCHV